jgi:hypothetical protein
LQKEVFDHRRDQLHSVSYVALKHSIAGCEASFQRYAVALSRAAESIVLPADVNDSQIKPRA